MKRFYINAVSFFGIILPLIGCLILIGVIFFIKNAQLGDFEHRKAAYAANQRTTAQALALKNNIGSKIEHLTTWHELFKQLEGNKAKSTLLGTLDSAIKESKTKTLRINSQGNSSSVRNFDQNVKGTTSSYDISLTGTYSEVQEALLKLERKLPNLFLNKMTVRPQAAGKFIEVNLTYTIWESIN